MDESEKIALVENYKDGWKTVQDCIDILKHAKNRFEFAMLYDLNDFEHDERIPQVFKNLRKKIDNT